jgi:hypothetical protein
MTSSSHKDVPEYDEAIVCENPECKHIGAAAITGLYGIAGGGGVGVYSVCEHCGTVLSKSLDPEVSCDSNEDLGSDIRIKNMEVTQENPNAKDHQAGLTTKPDTDPHSHD